MRHTTGLPGACMTERESTPRLFAAPAAKPVAMVGTSGLVHASWSVPTPEAFNLVGRNTGNLAFQHACWSLFEEEKFVVGSGFDAAAVRERASLLCLPAANFLYSGFDLGGLAARIEATKLPVLILGLGAQAFRSIDEVKLKPGTERFMQVIAERSKVIPVRGPYTAAVLERYGIKNFAVLGCPSNFINPARDLGAQILRRWRERRDFLAYAPTFYSYTADVEMAIFRAFEDRIGEIVAQDPEEAVAIGRGERSPALDEYLAAKAGFLSKLPEAERGRVVRLLRAYFNADAWLESYLRFDGVIGTRIHGINLGWQAGRAAMVVSYDLRTEELADTMGVPMVKSAHVRQDNIEALFDERIEACAPRYDERRARLATALMDVIRANALTPGAALSHLAGGGAGQGAPAPQAVPPAEVRTPSGPQVTGFLEQYNREKIAGWVRSDQPVPPTLVIRLNGSEVARTTPNRPRPDLGPHAWTYAVALPADYPFRDAMKVEVVVEATGEHLGNSPIVSSFALNDEEKVLRGRNGYLFLQNDTNQNLEQVQGRRPLTAGELAGWTEFFRRSDDAAARRGARIVYIVAPNKENVFAQHMPPEVTVSDDRPIVQLQDLVSRLGLQRTSLLYPLEEMRAAGPFESYSKGDTHWNYWGAWLAAKAVIEAAGGLLGPAETGPAPSEFRSRYGHSDLLSKLGGTCVEPHIVHTRPAAMRLVEQNETFNTGQRRRYEATAPGLTTRALMLHDSFGEWMVRFLAERCASLTTFWSTSLPDDLGPEEPLDLIICERAERFLPRPPVALRLDGGGLKAAGS